MCAWKHMHQIAAFYIYFSFTMQYYAYAKLHNGNISTLLHCEQWKMRNEQFSEGQEFGDVIVSEEARIRSAWNQSKHTHTQTNIHIFGASELEQNGIFFLLQPQDNHTAQRSWAGSCACMSKYPKCSDALQKWETTTAAKENHMPHVHIYENLNDALNWTELQWNGWRRAAALVCRQNG